MYSLTCDSSNPFAAIVSQLVMKAFPLTVSATADDVLELVFEHIMGTKQTRYGPRPPIESQAAIRSVIRTSMQASKPIPVLVAWGSEKPKVGARLDLAELMGIKMLNCLSERVRRHYEPGLDIVIRVEDASAPHLFTDRREEAREEARIYTTSFVDLVYILQPSGVSVVPESTLVTEEQFNAEADNYVGKLELAIIQFLSGNHRDSRDTLTTIGWSGEFTEPMVSYYLDRYQRLAPEATIYMHRHTLARYFAGVLARYRLGMRGNRREWGNDYMELSFSPPTPGNKFHGKRVFYRSVPTCYTSQHIAPWRACGYLEIDEKTNEACVKQMSFGEPLVSELEPFVLEFSRDGRTASVNAPFVCG